ncbi:MAG: phosphatase PAP2 family protein [Bacteroidales bacterium]|nr:phosphatase PAP2 family protein [Bacteroidales bacterium]
MLLFIIDIAYTISFFNGSIMQFFRTYLLLCIITIFIANLITYFWRISLHTIGMGGLLGLLASFYLEEPLFYTFAIELIPFFIILSGLVGTSRLYLKAHTPLQIYAGYAVGFFTIFLGMCFLKYL